MKRGVVFFFFFGVCAYTFSQSFKGVVQDARTRETITGAVVENVATHEFTSTDENGFFQFSSSLDSLPVRVQHGSYQPQQLFLTKQKINSIRLTEKEIVTEEVIVLATRVKKNLPFSYSEMSKKALQQQNFGQDVPTLLHQLPSTTMTSDAGNGIGYSQLRIRGSDASQVNVTINGVPYNDSESLGIFWVNIPDVAASSQSIQVQRGVGTSTQGAGAFGATINIQNDSLQTKPASSVSASYGSFRTRRLSVSASSGRIGKFSMDGRASSIQSDGFVDRASSQLSSYFVQGGLSFRKTLVKAVVFGGKEKTYQAWYGVPEARLNNDVEGMNVSADLNGFSPEQKNNLLHSSPRTFNAYTYPNQTDNYWQDHRQLHLTHRFHAGHTLQLTFHHTYGRGYYEEFRYNDLLANYGNVASQTTVTQSDIIRQRWLKNNFYGFIFSDQLQGTNWQLLFGGGWNQYIGDHFGIVNQVMNVPALTDLEYYFNRGKKQDGNVFTKATYQLSNKLTLFADAQARFIAMKADGVEDKNQAIHYNQSYVFFNPKAGVHYQVNPHHQLYSSVAVAHREPMRNDITDAVDKKIPNPERLVDTEVGYRFTKPNHSFSVNGYWMRYKNQLVSIGKLNNVGAAIRTNVPDSYRLGVELENQWRWSKHWQWQANVTLSRNKIKEFQEVLYDYGADYSKYDEVLISHRNTNIAYSPSVIASSVLLYHFSFVTLRWSAKHVGKQYLDNTSDNTRKISAYWVNDFQATGNWQVKKLKVELGFQINNFLNASYNAYGYTWGLIADATYRQNFYFPQAGRNYMLRCAVSW